MTSLVYNYCKSDEEAREFFPKYYPSKNLPMLHGCFGLVQNYWKRDSDFYFGMPFQSGFADKYVTDFNQFFSNIQIGILEKRTYYITKTKWGESYSTTKTENSIGDLEFVIFKVIFSKDANGEHRYSDIARFYLDVYIGETTRLYCTQYPNLEKDGLDKVENNFFIKAIHSSNTTRTFGKIITPSLSGKINENRVKWIDQPERMNKIIVEGRQIPFPIKNSWVNPGFVRFTHCPYPSYTNNLMKKGMMK